ncbi:MAG: type II toxin-antitoxin system RelE/ParE family toxin [Bacteroidales bacterium]|nr:type II toxin-antitoxin system RelE/ParE family toxin [Bacteroidales bacterium]
MAKQLIWSKKAQHNRKRIFEYWNKHNKSTTYSKKLNGLIKESLRLICKYPLIGKKTDIENIRIKILKTYLIIYEITRKNIIVLSIWDCRQNPDDLKRILK